MERNWLQFILESEKKGKLNRNHFRIVEVPGSIPRGDPASFRPRQRGVTPLMNQCGEW
jgi:hypothetical protein